MLVQVKASGSEAFRAQAALSVGKVCNDPLFLKILEESTPNGTKVFLAKFKEDQPFGFVFPDPGREDFRDELTRLCMFLGDNAVEATWVERVPKLRNEDQAGYLGPDEGDYAHWTYGQAVTKKGWASNWHQVECRWHPSCGTVWEVRFFDVNKPADQQAQPQLYATTAELKQAFAGKRDSDKVAKACQEAANNILWNMTRSSLRTFQEAREPGDTTNPESEVVTVDYYRSVFPLFQKTEEMAKGQEKPDVKALMLLSLRCPKGFVPTFCANPVSVTTWGEIQVNTTMGVGVKKPLNPTQALKGMAKPFPAAAEAIKLVLKSHRSATQPKGRGRGSKVLDHLRSGQMQEALLKAGMLGKGKRPDKKK